MRMRMVHGVAARIWQLREESIGDPGPSHILGVLSDTLSPGRKRKLEPFLRGAFYPASGVEQICIPFLARWSFV
jgi:hypothetical protein